MSLATDAATEAIYPLLPFFLTDVLRAGPVSLGLVEGAAEATNSIVKVQAGRSADRARRKRPLVLAGYIISSSMRPLMALATSWTHVFAVRVADRVGKGIRGAPRDAMLAAWASPLTRGKIYGFHRAMDHLGAVIGPALATCFLYFYPGQYRTLFALTIIPGAIAVALIFFVREDQAVDAKAPLGLQPPSTPSKADAKSDSWPARSMPPAFRRFMFVLALFTLGNSTDAFLLLKLTEAAGSAQFVPLMWSGLHVVKAVTSMVGGSWSDRVGRLPVIAVGWLIYAAVYAGFALSESLGSLLAWFLVYGVYFGLTEGTEKALVADIAPVARRGVAFGIYNAVVGLGSFAASVVFGIIWATAGPAMAFTLGACLALVSTALLFVAVRPQAL